MTGPLPAHLRTFLDDRRFAAISTIDLDG